MNKWNTRTVGNFCEQYVCDVLLREGYRILQRNYCWGKRSEIDIIAEKENILHFIEVKARSTAEFGTPAEAVTPAKCRKIQKASELFLVQNNIYDRERSYDIAEVYFRYTGSGLKIGKMNFLESAF